MTWRHNHLWHLCISHHFPRRSVLWQVWHQGCSVRDVLSNPRRFQFTSLAVFALTFNCPQGWICCWTQCLSPWQLGQQYYKPWPEPVIRFWAFFGGVGNIWSSQILFVLTLFNVSFDPLSWCLFLKVKPPCAPLSRESNLQSCEAVSGWNKNDFSKLPFSLLNPRVLRQGTIVGMAQNFVPQLKTWSYKSRAQLLMFRIDDDHTRLVRTTSTCSSLLDSLVPDCKVVRTAVWGLVGESLGLKIRYISVWIGDLTRQSTRENTTSCFCVISGPWHVGSCHSLTDYDKRNIT